jgi:hypothetical protein
MIPIISLCYIIPHHFDSFIFHQVEDIKFDCLADAVLLDELGKFVAFGLEVDRCSVHDLVSYPEVLVSFLYTVPRGLLVIS